MKHSIFLFLCLGMITQQGRCQSKNESSEDFQLIIKTIVAKGSISENEFGKQADWIEVMNKGKEDKEIIQVDSVSYGPLNENEQMAICRSKNGLVFQQLK